MKILIKIIKITSLSLLFAIIFNITSAYLSDEKIIIPFSINEVDNFSDTGNNNKFKFKKSNILNLSTVGVALSTNIGTKYKQRQNFNLYKNVPEIAKNISNKKYVNNTNNSVHIIKIKEYYNVLNTDIRKMIFSSYNKRETLDSYIDQLKYRFNNTIIQVKLLSKKKSELYKDLKSSSEKISLLKKKIDSDFRKFDEKATEKNINDLLIEKSKYNYAKTHIIFINQYLKQYQNLNNSNKKLLDTLINNKEALIKNVKIVIPNTGTTALKHLNLIINEKEYKLK